MEINAYGDPQAKIVLIQMVNEHDIAGIEQEVKEIQRLTDRNFQLLTVKVNNWNEDLSPWNAEPVFGKEGFGNGAKDTLKEVLHLCGDTDKR